MDISSRHMEKTGSDYDRDSMFGTAGATRLFSDLCLGANLSIALRCAVLCWLPWHDGDTSAAQRLPAPFYRVHLI